MTSLSKKAKRKHVALSKLKMDCLCRKLSPFFRQFLSAAGESEKDCRHILSNVACRQNPLEGLNNGCLREKTKILAKQFAHVISVHYRDFEHAYIY